MIRETEGRGVPACFSLFLAAFLLAAPVGAMAARVDVRRVLDASALGDPFVYDVDPSGAVLVLTGDNIYDAGSGEFLFGEPLKNPAWISLAGGKLRFLADGALFVVKGRTPRKLLEVPLKSPVAVSDGERTFISGITSAGRSVLFLFKEGVGHKALLELDAPIDAMAIRRGELLFTVGPRIYALKEGGKARLLAYLPGFSFIPSIAVDERDGVLYFSDGESIYAMRGGDFIVVRRGLGGMLRFREGSLYVLSRRARALFRVSGLSEALSSAGTLAPLADPCKAPVISLYCEAEAKRANLKAMAALAGSKATADTAASGEMGALMADRKKEIERITAALEKEAGTGAQAVLWGGGAEPKTIGGNAAIVTEKRGVGLTLWNGSEIRVGPDSKADLDDCGPSRECRQTLEKGLLYLETYEPSLEGMESHASRGFAIATKAMRLNFGSARIALFASGERAAVVVIEGRVQAASPQGGKVIVASGEMLEARRGEPLGMPWIAEMDRLNRWWEGIR